MNSSANPIRFASYQTLASMNSELAAP